MGRKLDHARSLYLDGIRDGKAREAVEAFTGDRYTQHSTGVRDGVEGFVEFFSEFIERNPQRDIDIVRGLEDGRYVFVHAYQNINDGEAQWVTMDFFDTDADDKIIEHWDVIAAYSPSTPSGHTSVDGTAEITDLDRTEANKDLVRAMIADVLMPGGDPTRIDQYISSETYIQHNAEVPDGIESFRTLATQANPPLLYDEIVLLVGCGNFVASLSRAYFEGIEYAQADLFRLEDGKIVEHWDAAEPTPSPEDSVNSGKF
ncbi:MAG: nuclear transport factor 2 family protein [Actinomycetota bacterium]